VTNVNLYATLAEFKAFATARGQTAGTDAADDAVISDLIGSVSRYIESSAGAGRRFYPSIETRLYDIPDGRKVDLHGDLLEVTSFLNGDTSAIDSTNYTLKTQGKTPYWQIALRDVSTVGWRYTSAGSSEQALSLTGWWGFRRDYAQRGWSSAGTLGAAITDTTTLAFTASSGHTLAVGQIIKIGSEIYNIATAVTNTITPVRRGDNGSTAALHDNSTTIYVWNIQEDIHLAVLETVLGVNSMRHGQASSGKITVTAAGMVIRPEEIPPMAQKTFESYRDIT